MNKKIVLVASLCLLSSTHAYSSDGEHKRSSGWYAGVSKSIVNVGGSVLLMSNRGIDREYDIDTSDDSLTLKAGYITNSENRVEVYYKDDSVNAENSGDSDFETSSFGINYQWGFSSLASEKMIPYLRVGAGLGSAKIEGAGNDLTLAEFDLGAGVHYNMTDNMGLSAGVYRRAIAISNDDNDNSLAFALNGAELGISYATY